MRHEKKDETEKPLHYAVEYSHEVNSLEEIGKGTQELLEQTGLWEPFKLIAQVAGLPTLAGATMAIPLLHVLTPVVAVALYVNANRHRAASAKEQKLFEAEEREAQTRVETYLLELSDPEVRADERRLREQMAYLVQGTAKKEDVWEVSRKLDRLLALNLEQLEAARVGIGNSLTLPESLLQLPNLLDRIAGLRDDIRGIRQVSEEILEIVQGRVAPVRNSVWQIPAPSAYFTGQGHYLDELKKILDAGGTGGITQPTGLRGLGGVGKTELALAYAKENRSRYDVGHFVVAESLTDLDYRLARIADPSLGEGATLEQIGPLRAKAVHDLGQVDRALLIFDNVDEIIGTAEFKAVLAHLPKAHTLVTCQHSDMGDNIKQLPVEKMDEGVGALYVLRLGLGTEEGGPWDWGDFDIKDQEYARLISQDLDGLPLALHHAGSAVRGESLSVREVLNDYRSNRARILNNRGGATEPPPIPIRPR